MANFHYRYIENLTSDGKGHVCGEVVLQYYLVLRETKCGFWISPIYGFWFDETPIVERTYDYQYYENDKIWVSKKTTKRRAYPTKEEAYVNFLMRKRRQVKILTTQLNMARRALDIAERKKLELIHCGSVKEDSTSRFIDIRFSDNT